MDVSFFYQSYKIRLFSICLVSLVVIGFFGAFLPDVNFGIASVVFFIIFTIISNISRNKIFMKKGNASITTDNFVLLQLGKKEIQFHTNEVVLLNYKRMEGMLFIGYNLYMMDIEIVHKNQKKDICICCYNKSKKLD